MKKRVDMWEMTEHGHRAARAGATALGVAVMVLVAAACGTSGSSSHAGNSNAPPAAASGPATGAGLTEPTSPSGSRVSGGTVYFTEGSDATPNYIFPMYSPQVCSTTNFNQLMAMLYRPLYWYGNDYRPTVDYNYSVGQSPRFSDGDRTVTITLNPYKWSDGETVTSRDLVFWMNVLKADPATEWCGYVPGYFPDNVVSYTAPNPQHVRPASE